MVVASGKTRPFFKDFDYFCDLENHFIDVVGPNQIYQRELTDLSKLFWSEGGRRDVNLLLRSMLITRRAEEKVFLLWKAGEIPGSIFSGLGNEATSCGVMAAMKYGDPAFPLHRDLGCDFTRGVEAFERGDIPAPLANLYFAQHMSKASSQCKGKDGNIHWGIPKMNRYPMISHLGTNIPNACGAALIEKFRNSGLVAFTFIGDGATSTPDFQALNQAASRKLPVIVIIDNNQWAYRTKLDEQTAAIPLSRKAEAFGIRGFTIDGTDALCVYALTKMAREIALSGTPVLIESVTFRMAGHSAYDPYEKYVPKEDLERWHRRDPIARLTNFLYGKPNLAEEKTEKFDQELNEIRRQLEKELGIEKELDEAIEWARNAPDPQTNTLCDDVYADEAAQKFVASLPDERRRTK